MSNLKRRISYILPAPSPDAPPPLLTLPPYDQEKKGHPTPFILPKASPNLGSRNPFLQPKRESHQRKNPGHPQHCLGVEALALDTTTVLEGESSPGGILYTAGRDGLVASWDLDVPHTRRFSPRYSSHDGKKRQKRIRWESIGDDAEFFEDDDEADQAEGSGSDEEWVDMKKKFDEVPYEDRWEVDKVDLGRRSPQTTFRQSAQTHTDWVNAMLLCNYNRTAITASSDRTIRAWTPHTSSDDQTPSAPALIGTHDDYVKSLAWAKGHGYLWSGGLDQKICLWDIKETRGSDPILTVPITDAEGERGSVYTLGTDQAGTTLAAGTAERTVRLWDARAGPKSTGYLIGHEDRVRSILISESGKYMLTGAADSTIKLWSLSAHRCLHTFTHSSSSIWSLFSSHPNLERFYSGSRDGYLCAIDFEGCGDTSQAECVVLAREGDVEEKGKKEGGTFEGEEGIRSIVAMDDEYVWTSTGSADVHRWRDVGRRISRLDKEFDGATYKRRSWLDSNPLSAVDGISRRLLDSGEDDLTRTDTRDSRSISFAPAPAARSNSDEATSPVSPVSAVPPAMRERLNHRSSLSTSSIVSDTTTPEENDEGSRNGIPYTALVNLAPDEGVYGFGGAAGSVLSFARRGDSPRHSTSEPVITTKRSTFRNRDVDSAAIPLRSSPDEQGRIQGREGLIRSLVLNDKQHVVTVDTLGGVAIWNIMSGRCVGVFDWQEIAEALHISITPHGEPAVRKQIRKYALDVLELVKKCVDGDVEIFPWCAGIDTKIGSLVVHLDEGRVFDADAFADELGVVGGDINEDTRINLGKWALSNLFRGLILAEEHEVTSHIPPSPTSPSGSSLHEAPHAPSRMRAPSLSTPIDRPPTSAHRKRAMTGSFSKARPTLNIPVTSPNMGRQAVFLDVPADGQRGREEGWRGYETSKVGTPGKMGLTGQPAVESPTLGMGSGALSNSYTSASGKDYFSARGSDPSPPGNANGGGKESSGSIGKSPAATPSGGGLMGKLKSLGKKKAAETAMPAVQEKEVVEEDTGPKVSEKDAAQLEMLDLVRSHHFHPPPPHEAPPLHYPPTTTLLLSEQVGNAGAWVVTYRSQVSTTERDMEALEMNSPMWLLDCIFANRVKEKAVPRVTFVLKPKPESGLPSLVEPSQTVFANRSLRAKRIYTHIADKLNDILPPPQAPQARLTPDDLELRLAAAPDVGVINGRTSVWQLRTLAKHKTEVLVYYSLKGVADRGE